MSASSLAPTPPAAVWWRGARPFSFTASVVPALVAAAWVLWRREAGAWELFPLVVACSLLFHAGTNYISDYHDFVRGVDRPGTKGSSGVLLEGLLRPEQVRRAAIVCFGLGVALGLVFVVTRGTVMLAIGAAGLAGGWLYCGGPRGYKYVALGDLLVFVLMGPLMVVGAHVALTGRVAAGPALVAIPVGLLVTGILAGNNLRDIRDDRGVGVHTVATLLGHRGAVAWYVALVVGAYAALPVLAWAGQLPWTSMLAVLSAPIAVGNVRTVLASREGDPAIDVMDMRTAQLHLAFSVLLAIGMIAGRLAA
jgi:1,4-dihydroxy-2-naphthoate octaprenyltransferase